MLMQLAPLAVVCALVSAAAAYPDKSPIRREFRAHLPQFRACYEKGLEKDPKLEGTVSVKVTIEQTGGVVEATSQGLPPIDACIAGVARTLKFPPMPKGKGPILVSYPLAFAPR